MQALTLGLCKTKHSQRVGCSKGGIAALKAHAFFNVRRQAALATSARIDACVCAFVCVCARARARICVMGRQW